MLGVEAKIVVEPDVVVAEPMQVVAGLLAESANPRRVASGVFAGVVAPKVAEAETVIVTAEPMGRETVAASAGREVDPKLVAFAANFAPHESVPRVAETVSALEGGPRKAGHLSGLVVALEADSRMVGSEVSRYL